MQDKRVNDMKAVAEELGSSSSQKLLLEEVIKEEEELLNLDKFNELEKEAF